MPHCPKHPTAELRLLLKKIFPQLAGDTMACPDKENGTPCDYRVLASEADKVAAPVFTKKKKFDPPTPPAEPEPVIEVKKAVIAPMPTELQVHQVALAEAEAKRQERKAVVMSLEETKAERRMAKKERREAAARAITSVVEGMRTIPQSAFEGARLMPECEMAAPKIDARSAFERATHAFIDGQVAAVGAAFVALFLSARTHDGTEAAVALEACRVAFDACNLALADVEVKATPKTNVGAVKVVNKAAATTKRIAKQRVKSAKSKSSKSAKGKK